jgi:hypothetical protein
MSGADQGVVGTIGEALAALALNLKSSPDPHDAQKDLISTSGAFIEVKTQRRLEQINSFTIPARHAAKCVGCELVFVEFNDTDYISVWHAHRSDGRYKFTTSGGVHMVAYPISKCCRLIKTIYNPLAAELLKHYSHDRHYKQYRFCSDFRNQPTRIGEDSGGVHQIAIEKIPGLPKSLVLDPTSGLLSKRSSNNSRHRAREDAAVAICDGGNAE